MGTKHDYSTYTDGELYYTYKWLARLIRSELPLEVAMRESRRDTLQAVGVEILRRSRGQTHFAGHKLAAWAQGGAK